MKIREEGGERAREETRETETERVRGKERRGMGASASREEGTGPEEIVYLGHADRSEERQIVASNCCLPLPRQHVRLSNQPARA